MMRNTVAPMNRPHLYMTPEKFEPAEDFSYDLFGDWRIHATAPGSDSVWSYYGTVTVGRVTGALAWSRGRVGIAVEQMPVRELGLFERMQIGHDIQTQAVRGWEKVPMFL